MNSSLKKFLKVAVYDQFWSIVKLNHSKVQKDIILPRDEAVALYAYTVCYPPMYQEINAALREGKLNNFLIKLVDSALDQLPIYQDRFVYRWSIPTLGEQEQLANNEAVVEGAYLSTLKEPNEITMVENDCMLLKVVHLNGRDIALYSDDYSAEIQEVLIPRGSSFVSLTPLDPDYDFTLNQVA
ncbi:ADP-ribosyltransferase [Photobacterium frigidiphilum]|uniref:ADP-ribosyltransferase n=1 Tax=Photobacterium frigidiphilum TaxID=264736 RepID=UPI003D0F1956